MMRNFKKSVEDKLPQLIPSRGSVAIFALHHWSLEGDSSSASVAMTVPPSLLLFDPSISPEEFRSPIEDWNALAQSVSSSSFD